MFNYYPAGQITSRTLSNDDHVLGKQNLNLFGDYTLLDQLDTVMGAVTVGYDDLSIGPTSIFSGATV